MLILAVLAFVAVNFYLWSRPFTQLQLFILSLPLGTGALAAFFWFVKRQ